VLGLLLFLLILIGWILAGQTMYVWLIVDELSFYASAQKKSNKHKRCEILGISKENLLHPVQQCVLLLGNSKKGTVQCLVPKHHLAVFLVVKYKYFQYIYI
jgi:hypothetical protein